MFRSLRFRLPALFLAAIVLAGLVSTAVAFSVFQHYTQNTLRHKAFRELDTEAAGFNKIYANHLLVKPPPSRELEQASGDQVFYVERAKGIDLFPGPTPAFTLLPKSVLDFRRMDDILAASAAAKEETQRVLTLLMEPVLNPLPKEHYTGSR